MVEIDERLTWYKSSVCHTTCYVTKLKNNKCGTNCVMAPQYNVQIYFTLNQWLFC